MERQALFIHLLKIMSGADLLKIFMLLGIAVALLLSRWMGKEIARLSEEIRLARIEDEKDREDL